MKSFFVLSALAACAFAQRLSILEPAGLQTKVRSGASFVAELQEGGSQSSLSQVSVTIAVTPCYDVCNNSSKWGGATVLYNGKFNPQHSKSHPEKGSFEDFHLTLPKSWPAGESVLSVAHLYKVGAVQTLTFDYTDVHFNVTK